VDETGLKQNEIPRETQRISGIRYFPVISLASPFHPSFELLDSPRSLALWVTAASVVLRLGDAIRLCLRGSCEAVDEVKLRFIPAYGKLPEVSEESQEEISVLSQIICFENFLFLTCGGAEPTMTARIEIDRIQASTPGTTCHLDIVYVTYSVAAFPCRRYIRYCSRSIR